MKAATSTSLFILLHFVKIQVNSSIVSSAIRSIVALNTDKFFKVDIILYQNTNERSDRLLDDILRQLSSSFSMKVITNDTKNLDNSCIVLFDSVQLFRENAAEIKWMNQPAFRNSHIVYAPNLTASDVIENIPDGFDIDHVVFLMNETEKSIDLVSSFLFTPRKCRQNQLETINRFSKTTGFWDSKEFYPEKYRNFYHCTLNYQFDNNNSAEIGKKLFIVIGKNLNFNIVASKVDSVWNSINDSDLSDHQVATSNANEFLISVPTMYLNFIWVVPEGEPFSQLDKMFMMFDREVWFAIGGFILFCILSIQIINRLPGNIKNFIYGTGINTPTMNLLDIFLNGGQLKVPRRNFARFTLVLFMYCSLIIRTCYQSMLYELLQRDIRKPRTVTVDEIFKKNLIVFSAFKNPYEEAQVTKVCNDHFKCLQIITEPINNGVSQLLEISFKSIEANQCRSGRTSLFALEEIVYNIWFGFGFKQFSPLFETFNDKIGQLQVSGIINYWNDNSAKLNEKKITDDIGPQKLTIDHLGVAFIACLIPLGLAVVVFFMEIIFYAAKKTCQEC